MAVAVTSTRPIAVHEAITVRPMSIEDLAGVRSMFRTAGDDALHDRFFTLGDRVVTAHLADLGEPSHPRCLVAVAHGHIVGIAEMAPVESGTEELAFLVARRCSPSSSNGPTR